MTTPPSSLIDRAGLDRTRVRGLISRGLEGADDGELFLEYRQSEMLVFDNGRLKQATYDTAQGFGLRAVKDEAVGYAHASDMSEAAIQRAAEAVRAVKGGYSGSYYASPTYVYAPTYYVQPSYEAYSYPASYPAWGYDYSSSYYSAPVYAQPQAYAPTYGGYVVR